VIAFYIGSSPEFDHLLRVSAVTAINLEYSTKQVRGTRARPASLTPWSQIGSIARAIAIIAALILAAAVPMLLRLWLYFPAIHE
jgi:hypothetical protein